MATFTLTEQNSPAGLETDSASNTLVTKPTKISVALSSSQWGNAALAGKRVLWGIQISTNGGTTWGPGTCTHPNSNPLGGSSTSVRAWVYATAIVGQRDRAGNMPSFTVSMPNMPPSGALVRVFTWPESAILLGASITAT